MKRFKNILVMIDVETSDATTIEKAIWLAKANAARLTLLDAMPQSRGALAGLFDSGADAAAAPINVGDVDDALHQARCEVTEAMAARCRDAGVETTTVMRSGPVFVSAIRQVLEAGHDLVMKGASDSGDRFFLSDDLHLMRKCPCPVWILQHASGAALGGGAGADGDDASVRVVVAAVDPDPTDAIRDDLAHTVMTLASSLAERTDAQLHVLNAWRLQEESALRSPRFKVKPHEVDAIVERARQRSEARLELLVGDFPDPSGQRVIAHRKGWAGDIAPTYAAEIGADTLVMGTVGRTGVSGFLIGNSAETILNRVRCSVMTVKPRGFTSPIGLDDAAAAP